MEPLVSVCLATYNHENFIAKTLDSILGQQGDFGIEILVHDDASTDQTASIVREYHRRYPEIIKPIYQKENQYQKGIAIDPTFNYPRAIGKYIALCEGDDWWCDVRKLEKQVSVMEKNPEITFLFSNARVRNQGEAREERVFFPYRASEKTLGLDKARSFTLGEQCKINFAPTATFIFPRKVLSKLPTTYNEHHCAHGDLKLRMFMTAAGIAYYLPDVTSVYREEVPNSAMQRWAKENSVYACHRAKEILQMLDDVDAFSKRKYHHDISELKKWYAYVMIFNAPNLDILQNKDAQYTFKTLSMGKRIRFYAKHLLKKIKK